LVPISVAILPTITEPLYENEWIHVGLAILALIIAYFSVSRGYKMHQSKMPVLLALPGLAMLWLSLFLNNPSWLEAALVSIGALMMATVHFLNHRLCRKC